jgi:hypothetical protein
VFLVLLSLQRLLVYVYLVHFVHPVLLVLLVHPVPRPLRPPRPPPPRPPPPRPPRLPRLPRPAPPVVVIATDLRHPQQGAPLSPSELTPRHSLSTLTSRQWGPYQIRLLRRLVFLVAFAVY